MRTASIVGVRTVYEGWGRYLLAEVRLAGGAVVARAIEDHGQAVAVLPYDASRRVALLVRQHRPPVLHAGGPASILEAPAGILDEPDPAAAAAREAFEETGVRLSAVEPAGVVWSMPGISTERMSLFLAAFAASDRTAAGGGLAEENEEIEVVEVSLAELAAMADDGRLDDLKTLCLAQTLRLRRPDLFAATA